MATSSRKATRRAARAAARDAARSSIDGIQLADRGRGRFGAVMTVPGLAGLAIATYLLAMRLVGEPPVCGPVRGCDTVAASDYATVLGLPVALYGVAWSLVVVVASVTWWLRAARPALYAAYGLGIVGVAAVAYLTYLEIAVIDAICVWCVSYAISVVLGWGAAIAALRSTPEPT
jgi:uncharacterized membrane protein